LGDLKKHWGGKLAVDSPWTFPAKNFKDRTLGVGEDPGIVRVAGRT